MKKLFLAAAAALLSFTMSAQIFVGGTMALNSNSSADKLANTTASNSAFTLMPNAGLILSDDLLVGARVSLRTTNNPGANTTMFGFGLIPYARYRLLEVGPFSLLAEGGINFSTQTTKQVTVNVGNQKNSITNFGLYVEPVITYPLDEHITLEAGLNIARLAFNSTSTKGVWHTDNPAGDTTNTDQTNSSFSFGASSDDIIGGGVGALTIGFTYKF